MSAISKPIFTVPVRELVEFVHRTGDLGGDGLFVGPNRALAGTLGHQWLQNSRPPEYQKEVRMAFDVECADFILRVQGRLDGVIVESDGARLEEIKTVGNGWDGVADPLHWAQAKCYGYVYAHDHALHGIAIQLTYLDFDTKRVTEFREAHTFAELTAFFTETMAVYQQWMQEQFEWRQVRDASIRQLAFPFANYRPGQRELAVAAYRALARGERLFLEAPTGIGKTISVLFPAVKALGERKLERIFYLTATTLGRVVAEKAAADLRRGGLKLRTLTLTAKGRLCVRDGQPCDVRTCPLALGYYDRRRPAIRAALAREEITRSVLEALGNEFQVCPFELSLDVSEWVDVVICDYNYVFDPKVYLRRHFAEEGGDFGFLVDEAHNLVDRAREMFSADLNTAEVREVAKTIKKTLPRCAKALNRLGTGLEKLPGMDSAAPEDAEEILASHEDDLFSGVAKTEGDNAALSERGSLTRSAQTSKVESNTPSISPCNQSRAAHRAALRDGTLASAAFPAALTPLLEDALNTAAEWLARNEPADFRDSLLELYFRLNSFARTAELYDVRYVTLVKPGDAVAVKLFCLDPSHLLDEALERGRGAILFSATLSPIDYYRRLLGGDEKDVVWQLPSPFAPENLCVLVQDRIRTQFKERANSRGEVVRAIGTLVEGRPGNYLIYFPSYHYLTTVLGEFQTKYPAVPVLVQRPGMSEAEREAFLGEFAVEHGRTLAGFAVLGGIFGEGIDLVGDRLIGVVVVGVGLPQLEVERDLIADYFQQRNGRGFDYAYTFPGMNRVLQATGRVIRSETDRGVVLLIDARFRESRYRQLFPAWWRPVAAGKGGQVQALLKSFWEFA